MQKAKPINTFTYHKGDVMKAPDTGDYDMFAHGCNCFGVMGAGVALQVSRQMPWLCDIDYELLMLPENRLGSYSHVKLGGMFYFNLYTQYHFGGEGRNLNYGAIISAFNSAFYAIDDDDLYGYKPMIKVCMPRIGAGLGGGDWSIIEEMLAYHCFERTIEFHVYDL